MLPDRAGHRSTLLNALSSADVFAENMLFATLDPTTRKCRLPGTGGDLPSGGAFDGASGRRGGGGGRIGSGGSGQEVLLTDTVGFIQKLPPHLGAAFRATLEEVCAADVLVHVVDASAPRGLARKQKASVEATLASLGAAGIPTVVFWNKVDALPPGGSDEGDSGGENDEGDGDGGGGGGALSAVGGGAGASDDAAWLVGDDHGGGVTASPTLPWASRAAVEAAVEAAAVWPVAVAGSARTGDGLDRLCAAVEQLIKGAVLVPVEARLPYTPAAEEAAAAAGAEAAVARAARAARTARAARAVGEPGDEDSSSSSSSSSSGGGGGGARSVQSGVGSGGVGSGSGASVGLQLLNQCHALGSVSLEEFGADGFVRLAACVPAHLACRLLPFRTDDGAARGAVAGTAACGAGGGASAVGAASTQVTARATAGRAGNGVGGQADHDASHAQMSGRHAARVGHSGYTSGSGSSVGSVGSVGSGGRGVVSGQPRVRSGEEAAVNDRSAGEGGFWDDDGAGRVPGGPDWKAIAKKRRAL